jgi:hypothetical protein
MKSYKEYYTEFMDSLFNRQKKPIVISIWKIIFFILLIINGIFFYWAGTMLSSPGGGMALLVVFPLALPLAIIDFIAVLSYIITHHFHGIARVISDAVLIIMSFILIVLGIMSYTVLCSSGGCS